jgi:hypothetical protein
MKKSIEVKTNNCSGEFSRHFHSQPYVWGCQKKSEKESGSLPQPTFDQSQIYDFCIIERTSQANNNYYSSQ